MGEAERERRGRKEVAQVLLLCQNNAGISMLVSRCFTFRAMGSSVKSHTSPMESSRASSIPLSWEVYSSRNLL